MPVTEECLPDKHARFFNAERFCLVDREVRVELLSVTWHRLLVRCQVGVVEMG
jgi:hypothetical protein